MHLKSLSQLTVYFFLLWGSISPGIAQEVSLTSQDTTAAGRWSLIAGTAFLNAGERPYIDREGSMWWGYQDNVFVLRQNQLSKITVGWPVNAIVQDSTGAMWFFGHHSDSLIVSRYDGIIREITKTQVKWNLIMSPPAVVDGKGRFWMRALYRRSGSYPGYGIYEYSNNRWYHHATEAGLKHDRIYDLTVDQKGHLWAATLRSASQYRDGQWHNFDHTDGLSNQKVYRIAVGKNGDIWCTHGNRDDISVYDGDKWRVINTDSGMPIGKVRAALCARDGTFWFGVHYDDITDPEQSGLVRFDGQSWLVLTERDGLPGNHVLKIFELLDSKLLLQIRKPTSTVFELDTTPLQISNQSLVVFEPDTTRWARVSGYVENRDGTAIDHMAVSLATPKGHVKASTVTDAQGFYEMRVLPGKYRVQLPDAWGGKRDIVVAPGETVSGVDIRPFWFINSETRNTVFGLVFFFFIVMVLVGLLYIVIRAFAVQPLKVPELSGEHNPLRLRFHGNGSSLFGIFVINVLFTLLTLGVYYFWGKAKIRRYMHSQTEFHNSRFSNHTTGGELCIGWIKAIILIRHNRIDFGNTLVFLGRYDARVDHYTRLLRTSAFCVLASGHRRVPCVSDSAELLIRASVCPSGAIAKHFSKSIISGY